MLKGIKKKWTDITIALALPLVIWNGATGIYNQWEEVQDEKDVPRMIAAQRFDDMLFVWHMWCNDAISTTDQPDEGVKTACEQIPPVGTSYEEFQTFPKKLIGDVDADVGFTCSVFDCRIGAMV